MLRNRHATLSQQEDAHARHHPPSSGAAVCLHARAWPQVDCTQEAGLCREHIIQGFPSIRVFRKGHDDVYIGKV